MDSEHIARQSPEAASDYEMLARLTAQRDAAEQRLRLVTGQ